MRRERQFMSVRDFAALVSVSSHTVWRWIRTGLVPAYGVGRLVVDVDEALERIRYAPPAPAPTPIRGGAYREIFPRAGQAGRPRGRQTQTKKHPA